MQTFITYKGTDFSKTAKILDNKRLGKQRVEALQILKALNGEYKSAWINHPAVKMWRGYRNTLVYYGQIICQEWVNRGFKDTCYKKISSYYISEFISPFNHTEKIYKSLTDVNVYPVNIYKIPPFLNSNRFIRGMRSNLLRKNPKYYKKYFKNTPNNLEYYWPVK